MNSNTVAAPTTRSIYLKYTKIISYNDSLREKLFKFIKLGDICVEDHILYFIELASYYGDIKLIIDASREIVEFCWICNSCKKNLHVFIEEKKYTCVEILYHLNLDELRVKNYIPIRSRTFTYGTRAMFSGTKYKPVPNSCNREIVSFANEINYLNINIDFEDKFSAIEKLKIYLLGGIKCVKCGLYMFDEDLFYYSDIMIKHDLKHMIDDINRLSLKCSGAD